MACTNTEEEEEQMGITISTRRAYVGCYLGLDLILILRVLYTKTGVCRAYAQLVTPSQGGGSSFVQNKTKTKQRKTKQSKGDDNKSNKNNKNSSAVIARFYAFSISISTRYLDTGTAIAHHSSPSTAHTAR
jgi:hypothetical protein